MPTLTALVKSLVIKVPPFSSETLLSDAVNWYSVKIEKFSFNFRDKPKAALKAGPVYCYSNV